MRVGGLVADEGLLDSQALSICPCAIALVHVGFGAREACFVDAPRTNAQMSARLFSALLRTRSGAAYVTMPRTILQDDRDEPDYASVSEIVDTSGSLLVTTCTTAVGQRLKAS
jgi:hypothetical protein